MSWKDDVRHRVETRLAAFLDDKREEARHLSPESMELVEAVASLTLRGGKRARPMVVAAGYHAIRGDADDAPWVDPGAAMELLQTYLLIHDDWMDQDDERRGGPSVWAMLRDAHDDPHLGASLGVLAGDLASAYASELMTHAPYPPPRLKDALDVYWLLQREVFFGQQLDLIATEDVEKMYDLKTGSYTVRGPLRLGALLADASEAQLRSLDRFAAPLGVAFQLRDEILGTFGDPTRTGKPAGNDLRAGKRTRLLQLARTILSREDLARLDAVFGDRGAPQEAVQAVTDRLEQAGARAQVETRLGALIEEAEAALRDAGLHTERLAALVSLLANRDR